MTISGLANSKLYSRSVLFFLFKLAHLVLTEWINSLFSTARYFYSLFWVNSVLFNLELVISYSISFILLFNLNSFILYVPINSLCIRDYFAKGLTYVILLKIFLSPRSSLDHPSWVFAHHWTHWTGDHHFYTVLQWHIWDPTSINLIAHFCHVWKFVGD